MDKFTLSDYHSIKYPPKNLFGVLRQKILLFGVLRHWEVSNNLNPLVDDVAADSDSDKADNLLEYQWGIDPHDPDTDDDSMVDGWEINNALNPLINDGGSDPDGDGLSNHVEFQYNTDPHDTDTDDDGYSDSVEILGPIEN